MNDQDPVNFWKTVAGKLITERLHKTQKKTLCISTPNSFAIMPITPPEEINTYAMRARYDMKVAVPRHYAIVDNVPVEKLTEKEIEEIKEMLKDDKHFARQILGKWEDQSEK